MSNLVAATFAGLCWWFGYVYFGYMGSILFGEPIALGFIFGLVSGRMADAMMIAVAVELVYVGMISPGANIPSDQILAGAISIPIALQAGLSPEMAVVIAVPFGSLGTLVNNLRRIVNAEMAHICDRAAERGDEKAIWRATTIYPHLIGFVMRFIPAFVIVYFGSDMAAAVVEAMPAWLTHGFTVAGGVMPAIGFAMIVTLIGKPSLMPFFFIGFFLVQYAGISTMTAAVFGIPLAFVIVMMRHENNENVLYKAAALVTGRISNDDDDDD